MRISDWETAISQYSSEYNYQRELQRHQRSAAAIILNRKYERYEWEITVMMIISTNQLETAQLIHINK